MGQLYLEFDENELKKNLELFERIQNEKNGDLEEAFKLFADKYINDEMDLPVFLQVVNKLYRDIYIIGDISLYQQLLEGIEKVKKYVEEKNCKIGIINIYEILIDIYNSMYDFKNVCELSKELLSIDEGNKIALLNLSEYEGEGENKKSILNYSIDDLAILNNIALFNMNNKNIDKSLEYYEYIVNTIRNTITKIKKDGYISSQNSLYDIYIGDFNPCKYNKYIVYMCKKGKKYQYNRYYIDINKKVKVFPNYCWKAPFFDYPYLRQTLSSLGNCYHYKFKEDKKIENYKKAEELYLESIEFMIRNWEDEFDLCVDPWGDYILAFDPIYLVPAPIFIDRWIKDTIINLINLYYENNEYKKGKSLDDCSNLLTKNFDCDSLVDFINIINKIAGKIVIDNSIEIKNKKVLISLYEIMSVSRKELIVMRLFDYIRNADAYANMKINNDTEEQGTGRIAIWKGENVEIKNEYILCYHFHSSSEIQYKEDEHGNFQLNEEGEKIPIRISVRGESRTIIWRKLPAENWIAVNQIRDTLAHRINENDTDVNEAIRTTKKAREFIEANFTSIIECLFNVIKENKLLSEPKFDSEDF